LILSRDQTLILSCEMFVVPVEFKVHFNERARDFRPSRESLTK
jgi:hypothetical protein